MDLDTFEELRKFKTTSWAIWGADDDCSVDFFRFNLDRLHGKVNFLGLNRSNKWPRHLENGHMPNFHTPGHAGDRNLKAFIQDYESTNLIGGFMTDLSDEIQSDSSRVTIENGAVDSLIKKVALVDVRPVRYVICLVTKSFAELRKGLPVKSPTKTLDHSIKHLIASVQGETWKIFGVWYSGNWGNNLNKIVELASQLKMINRIVAEADI